MIFIILFWDYSTRSVLFQGFDVSANSFPDLHPWFSTRQVYFFSAWICTSIQTSTIDLIFSQAQTAIPATTIYLNPSSNNNWIFITGVVVHSEVENFRYEFYDFMWLILLIWFEEREWGNGELILSSPHSALEALRDCRCVLELQVIFPILSIFIHYLWFPFGTNPILDWVFSFMTQPVGEQ